MDKCRSVHRNLSAVDTIRSTSLKFEKHLNPEISDEGTASTILPLCFRLILRPICISKLLFADFVTHIRKKKGRKKKKRKQKRKKRKKKKRRYRSARERAILRLDMPFELLTIYRYRRILKKGSLILGTRKRRSIRVLS